jgi:hypothetical protein
MKISEGIKDAAINEANRLQSRAAQAQDELEKIKIRQLELEAAIESARLASQRARDFKPGRGPDYPCPRCFVVNETRSVLRPLPSPTSREDYFRCVTCDYELVVLF